MHINMLGIKTVTVLIIINIEWCRNQTEVSMENEIKSVLDIIAEISKKDKKKTSIHSY